MPSAFGNLTERLISATVHFIPDGETLDSTETSSKTQKPASTDWPDYDLGRITKVSYVPRTKDRVREWGKATGGYQERTDTVIIEDIMELTMVDYAEKLFDQLMFGMASTPVSGTPQQAFASASRHKDGWIRLHRINEDGTTLAEAELHVRLSILTAPEDNSEFGAPVWRINLLGDAGALDTIEMTYPA